MTDWSWIGIPLAASPWVGQVAEKALEVVKARKRCLSHPVPRRYILANVFLGYPSTLSQLKRKRNQATNHTNGYEPCRATLNQIQPVMRYRRRHGKIRCIRDNAILPRFRVRDRWNGNCIWSLTHGQLFMNKEYINNESTLKVRNYRLRTEPWLKYKKTAWRNDRLARTRRS